MTAYTQLSTRAGAALPLIPAALCSIAAGLPSAPRRVAVLRAGWSLGVPAAGIDEAIRVMDEGVLGEPGVELLYALRSRLDTLDPAQADEQAFSALCLAGAVAVADGPPGPAERAILHAIATVLLGERSSRGWTAMEVYVGASVPRPIGSEARRVLRRMVRPAVVEKPLPGNPFDELWRALPIEGIALRTRPGVHVDAERFLRSVARSISLTRADKTRILESVPGLTQGRIDELGRVLDEERAKFLALSADHWPEVRRLVHRHAIEWFDVHAYASAGA
jgi:hypothetical protein